jgi:dTDP-4-amino-4,6-dideoxygalactose transaminase
MENSKSVPSFDIKLQTENIRAELLEVAARVIDSGAYILGPEVNVFEQEFAAATQSRHAISCASGSDALLLALMALDIGPGDEVCLPSFTYYATASCVKRVGATPVFIDCDSTYNMSIEDLEQRLSPNTKAIIPVHLFGQMLDVKRLQSWVAGIPQKVHMIEDCAQSMGASFSGRHCGTWGDIGTFSFYPTKNLGGLGDGGMMTVQSAEINDRLRILRVHGEKKKYFHDVLGINSRLDALQAAFLRVKLRHLDSYERARAAIADRYLKAFEAANIFDFITLPIVLDDRKHVWNQFTIRVKNREQLISHLVEDKIGTNIYYPLPQHLQKTFAYLGYKRGDLYMSEKLAGEVLSLPMYPEMPLENVDRVVDSIRSFYRLAQA